MKKSTQGRCKPTDGSPVYNSNSNSSNNNNVCCRLHNDQRPIAMSLMNVRFSNVTYYVNCRIIDSVIGLFCIYTLTSDTVPNHTFITTKHQALFIYNQTISGASAQKCAFARLAQCHWTTLLQVSCWVYIKEHWTIYCNIIWCVHACITLYFNDQHHLTYNVATLTTYEHTWNVKHAVEWLVMSVLKLLAGSL